MTFRERLAEIEKEYCIASLSYVDEKNVSKEFQEGCIYGRSETIKKMIKIFDILNE